MLKAFKDQIRSVAHLRPLYNSPGWYKYRTFTKGGVFSFGAIGPKYGVEGLAEKAFSLIASAGFLPIKRVTSLFKADETTLGSLLTHLVDRWSSGRRISTAYWCPNSCSARVRFNLSTMAWSRWISVPPRPVAILCPWCQRP